MILKHGGTEDTEICDERGGVNQDADYDETLDVRLQDSVSSVPLCFSHKLAGCTGMSVAGHRVSAHQKIVNLCGGQSGQHVFEVGVEQRWVP